MIVLVILIPVIWIFLGLMGLGIIVEVNKFEKITTEASDVWIAVVGPMCLVMAICMWVSVAKKALKRNVS